MKYFILFYIVFFSTILSAKCVIIPDLNNPSKMKIENRTQARNVVSDCPLDDKGKQVTDIDETKIIQVEEDDLEKPIFEAKSKVTSCANQKECYGIIKPVCDEESPPNCVGYCDSISNEHFPIVAQDFTEVYCTKRLGFEKKIVDVWVFDPVKRAAKQAQKDAQEADRAAREAKRPQRISTLKSCNNNPPNNIPGLRSCQEAIIKHIIESEFQTGDL